MWSGSVDANTLERWGGEEEGDGEGSEFDFSDWDYLQNPIHKYLYNSRSLQKITNLKKSRYSNFVDHDKRLSVTGCDHDYI